MVYDRASELPQTWEDWSLWIIAATNFRTQRSSAENDSRDTCPRGEHSRPIQGVDLTRSGVQLSRMDGGWFQTSNLVSWVDLWDWALLDGRILLDSDMVQVRKSHRVGSPNEMAGSAAHEMIFV